jgi:predicted nuclease with RNAse H fold
MPSSTVYIGVDPTAGRRATTYVVLDEQLGILQCRSGLAEEVIAAILAYPVAVCAIDAPGSPNKNLLATPHYRTGIGLEPNRDNYATYRVSEYELRRRGIYVTNTPADTHRLSDWVIEGWRLYDQLRAAGFADYPAAGPRRLFETYPYAAFTVLVGSRPYPKTGLEGRLQRQLILFDMGVGVPDPMLALEELTEHRLRTGQLHLTSLHTHDELDALVSAYTAFLLDHQPENVIAVGDPAEGQILIPARSLEDTYP